VDLALQKVVQGQKGVLHSHLQVESLREDSRLLLGCIWETSCLRREIVQGKKVQVELTITLIDSSKFWCRKRCISAGESWIELVLPYLRIYFNSFDRRRNLTEFNARSQTYLTPVLWHSIALQSHSKSTNLYTQAQRYVVVEEYDSASESRRDKSQLASSPARVFTPFARDLSWDHLQKSSIWLSLLFHTIFFRI